MASKTCAGANILARREIRDGAGDLEDAIVSPRAQMKFFHGSVEEFASLHIQFAVGFQQAMGDLGIGATFWFRCKAFLLEFARGEDAFAGSLLTTPPAGRCSTPCIRPREPRRGYRGGRAAVRKCGCDNFPTCLGEQRHSRLGSPKYPQAHCGRVDPAELMGLSADGWSIIASPIDVKDIEQFRMSGPDS
jgi:hypothetical protein